MKREREIEHGNDEEESSRELQSGLSLFECLQTPVDSLLINRS